MSVRSVTPQPRCHAPSLRILNLKFANHFYSESANAKTFAHVSLWQSNLKHAEYTYTAISFVVYRINPCVILNEAASKIHVARRFFTACHILSISVQYIPLINALTLPLFLFAESDFYASYEAVRIVPRFQNITMFTIEMKMACIAASHFLIGGSCGDRTCDKRIKSPLLYQLS